jgi:class 3 adenylate cyclase
MAELFESATLLFSDIPAFANIVAECQPMDVIDFLSQLHTSFDNIVARFDAYKVETINDSYVVRESACSFRSFMNCFKQKWPKLLG